MWPGGPAAAPGPRRRTRCFSVVARDHVPAGRAASLRSILTRKVGPAVGLLLVMPAAGVVARGESGDRGGATQKELRRARIGSGQRIAAGRADGEVRDAIVVNVRAAC